jgi:UDP-N-acetylmuramoyl-tripeptide--D-alanyl-D-alanine ligase
MDHETDCAVIEMGISEEGGMDRLSRMVRPSVAIVTNIGVSHMEFLGSREGIRNEKLKIISRMDESGVLLLNADDPLLYAVKDSLPVKVVTYGCGEDADIRATGIGLFFSFRHKGGESHDHAGDY